jgi:glucose-1-phosphate adenylyltransferase
MKNTMAMILAGGRGKRMDLLCQQRPKPALPFAGKYGIIDFTLSNCYHSEINKVAVLVDYQRTAMTEYLKQWSSANKAGGWISILPPKSGCYKGTADAVYQNLYHAEPEESEDVLILAGDHIYNMDYRKMFSFHHEKQADVTVGLVRVPILEAYRFGTATTGNDGRIREFVEKSSNPASDLASMGIYIFKRKFLEEQLEQDARNPNSPHDFGYTIIPGSIKQAQVFGYKFEGYWRDIGTVEAYYAANMQLLEGAPGFAIEDIRPVLTLDHNSTSSFSNVPDNIVNSLISPGCVIEGYVENSILSPGVRVREKARVINSVVMANTCIGYHSVVDTCILDEGVDIGQFCYIGFGTTPMPKVGEITVVGKDVCLGPQTAIGRTARILPGLKLADFNSRFVAPGTVVSVSK